MAPSLPSSPPGSRVTPLDPRRTMAPPAPMSVRTQDEEPRSPEQGNMHEARLPDRGVTDGQGCPAPLRLRPASCAPGPQLDPKHREVEEQAQDRQTDGRGERRSEGGGSAFCSSIPPFSGSRRPWQAGVANRPCRRMPCPSLQQAFDGSGFSLPL